MVVVPYRFEPEPLAAFRSLVDSLYGRQHRRYLEWHRPFLVAALRAENPFFRFGRLQSFLGLEGQQPVGHCSAMVDQRIAGVGLIGFFECVRDPAVASALLDEACAWLRSQGAAVVRAPVDLSIWHRYRFMHPARADNLFSFEPFNLAYYPEYFLAHGFRRVGAYRSAYRRDVSDIVAYAEPGYRHAVQAGFSLRPVNLKDFTAELKIFHALALKIFAGSWSYVPISWEEFFDLYGGLASRIDPRYCQFIGNGKREVGFCFSLPDPLGPGKRLVIKSIGVLPKFQRQQLGSALIYAQHRQAQADGYDTVVYALLREGNVASQINPAGATVFRTYETYELGL